MPTDKQIAAAHVSAFLRAQAAEAPSSQEDIVAVRGSVLRYGLYFALLYVGAKALDKLPSKKQKKDE